VHHVRQHARLTLRFRPEPVSGRERNARTEPERKTLLMTSAPNRRVRDLVTDLPVVALVATVTAVVAVVACGVASRVPVWAWLPLLPPVALQVALVTNWLRGGYLPPVVDDGQGDDPLEGGPES
jgi:hypothetical protein